MKQIPRPDLKSATVLTPPQLNALHFSGKHTLLSPDYLKKALSASNQEPK